MKHIFPLFLCVALLMTACARQSGIKEVNRDITPCAGQVKSINIYSQELGKTMQVDIWTPDSYPQKGVCYPVLYLHDGQNVLDSAHTWMHNEWQADEAVTRLQKTGRIRVPVIVAIYNDKDRGIDYMPDNYFNHLPDSLHGKGLNFEGFYVKEAHSRQYVDFICNTLKTYIDSTYQTDPTPESTVLMGSSMGALVSLYAMQYRPDIFGCALCLSYPTIGQFWNDVQKTALDTLPSPENHRIYIDTGDAGLDATFFPAFNDILPLLQAAGYDKTDMQVSVYPGHDHSEGYWAKRLDIPLIFALEK